MRITHTSITLSAAWLMINDRNVSSNDHPTSKYSLNVCPSARLWDTCFMHSLVPLFIHLMSIKKYLLHTKYHVR